MAGACDTLPTPGTTMGRPGWTLLAPSRHRIDAGATALEAMTALAGTYDANPVD